MELSVSVLLHIFIKIYMFELGVIIGLSRLRRLWYKSYGSFLSLRFSSAYSLQHYLPNSFTAKVIATWSTFELKSFGDLIGLSRLVGLSN